MDVKPKYSDEDIEDGLDMVAKIIQRYGNIYWPIFECLEYELQERRSRAARLSARLNSKNGISTIALANSKKIKRRRKLSRH
jgi:hypothetical protein